MDITDKHILLIGLRASGKTTLGTALAARLHRPFVDLDDRTALELGFEAAGDALRTMGEDAFRRAEMRALEAACAEGAQVIALGGGTPMAPGAGNFIEKLRTQGRAVVLFLDPPLETLATRLRTDAGNRPSLTGRGVVEELEEIARRRRRLYAALADFAFDGDTDVERVERVLCGSVG